MDFIKLLLSENSEISTMRFMAIASLIFSFCIVIYGLYFGKDVIGESGIFLGAAFGGKLSQKIFEVKA